MNIDHQNCILLGKGGATQSDEFLEKFQRGEGGGVIFQKFIMQILGTLNRFFLYEIDSNFRVQGMFFSTIVLY